MLRIKWFIFLFFGVTVYSQKLHHQMISTQGINTKLKNGMAVKQSVGQQSSIGNYNTPNFSIGQGYIQSNLSSDAKPITKNIATIVYPNPFKDFLNFKFSSPINGNIKVTIFDVRGRLIYLKETLCNAEILTISEMYFSEGTYFVKLEAKGLIYSSQIIKIK